MTPTEALCERIRQQVRSHGAVFDPKVLEATRAVYRPHIDTTPVALEQADLAYGDDARHRLDLYAPAGKPRAVVVFVHGGGFVAGDKNGDGVFYPNIGRWLARQGIAAVLPNYRLAPAHGWPAGAQDVQAVVSWVRSTLGGIVGATGPLFVLGQSAGACHVATWLFDESIGGTPGPDLVGVMLMSGFYRARAPLAPGIAAYFGSDESQLAARSPWTHVRRVDVPLWLSLAEFDPAPLAAPTFALAEAITLAQGASPVLRWFAGHNHVSTVQSLGSPQQDVGEALLAFIDAQVS